MQEYIIGALWYSCSIAIYAILRFETATSSCLRGIDPTWKFWGAKIIVSVAGMQRLGLYALMQMGLFTEVFTWYLHAYFLCFETLLLSLLHFKAYPASGHFVHGTPRASKSGAVGSPPATYGKLQVIMENEDGPQASSPDGSIDELSVLVAEPSPLPTAGLPGQLHPSAPQVIGQPADTGDPCMRQEEGIGRLNQEDIGLAAGVDDL